LKIPAAKVKGTKGWVIDDDEISPRQSANAGGPQVGLKSRRERAEEKEGDISLWQLEIATTSKTGKKTGQEEIVGVN